MPEISNFDERLEELVRHAAAQKASVELERLEVMLPFTAHVLTRAAPALADTRKVTDRTELDDYPLVAEMKRAQSGLNFTLGQAFARAVVRYAELGGDPTPFLPLIPRNVREQITGSAAPEVIPEAALTPEL